MTWVPKAGTPEIIRPAELMATLITGDPGWGWLVNWLPYLPQEQMTAVEFCALGPTVDVPQLQQSDFAQVMSPWQANLAEVLAYRAFQLSRVVSDYVFGQICEQEVAGGSHCTVFEADLLMPTAAQAWAPPRLATSGSTSLRITCLVLSTNGIHDFHVHWFTAAGAYLTETFAPAPLLTAVNQVQVHARPALGAQFQVVSNGAGTRVRLEFCGIPGTIQEHTPLAQPEPDGILPPATRTYDDLVDVGAELDRLEYKLDQLLALGLANVRTIVAASSAADSAPLEAPANAGAAPIPLGTKGIMIVVTGVPSWRSVRTDDPNQYPSLGWLTLQTEWGNYMPRELVHVNTIIAPLPPYVNGYSIAMDSPMQFAVYPIGEKK